MNQPVGNSERPRRRTLRRMAPQTRELARGIRKLQMREEIIFDNKMGRFRDKRSSLVALEKIKVESLLWYPLIRSLDRNTALKVRDRLQRVTSRDPVLDAKITMALNDLGDLFSAGDT